MTGKPPNLLRYEQNDYGNAQRLLTMYEGDLRYCPPTKSWLIWDNRRWQIDQRNQIRELAQKAMLEFAAQALRNRSLSDFAGRSLNSARISNCIREAQPLVSVLPAELDVARYALNFLNGTLDLRTGELRPHDRKQLLTKLVHTSYDAEAQCPQFLAFMSRSLGELTPYVQKCLGYSLTGNTCEKAVFWCYGPANSGKTTLLELVRNTFPEYSTIIRIDSLSREDNNSQADLADLRGIRFCMTSETEEGQTLREGKLKRITQGQGIIKSTRKYENPITFPETHKLWVDSNHKPTIIGADDAIWNRLHVISFEHPLTLSEIDRELPNKLREEAPGIAAWVVEGARRWHQEGLGRSAPVENARAQWRAEMDGLGEFFEAHCEIGAAFEIGARELYTAYRNWAQGAGECALTETAFGLRLGARGFAKHRGRTGVTYDGIRLRDACSSHDGKVNGRGKVREAEDHR